MKNKIHLKYWWTFIFVGYLTACHEYDMIKYREKPAINFAAIDDYDGSVKTGVNYLSTQYNFTYRDGIQDTIGGILVVVQGNLVHEPIDVTVTTRSVEGYRTPEVEFLRKSYIPSGNYFDTVPLLVKCPLLSDTLYAVDLVFDYDHSNVSTGVTEKQAFRLIVSNGVFKSLKIDEQTWKEVFEPYVGEFSRVKAKFMIEIGEVSLLELSYMMDDWVVDYFVEELEAYNAVNPPLTDEYGRLVKFEPNEE